MPQLAVGSRSGRYRIEAAAGSERGAVSVYRATSLDREPAEVLLKVLEPWLTGHPELRRAFDVDARRAAALSHPGVLPLCAAGIEDQRLFVATPYVEGQTLDGLIRARQSLDPRLAADIVGHLGSALDAIHACGMVHGELRPHNVVVADHDGRTVPYLSADFWLETLIRRALQHTT